MSQPKMIAWGQAIYVEGGSPPGNSREHIECASSLGFDGIELDLQITRDGIPVLLHDWTIDKETDGSGNISGLTYDHLRRCSKGWWRGNPVHTLSLADALRIENRPRIVIADMRIRPARACRVAEAVNAAGFNQRDFFISAYDSERVRAYAAALPDSPIFLKDYKSAPDIPLAWLDQAAELGCAGVMFQVERDVQPFPEVVAAAHERGLEVITFIHTTARKPEDMEAQIASRVDYILTTIGPGLMSRHTQNFDPAQQPSRPVVPAAPRPLE